MDTLAKSDIRRVGFIIMGKGLFLIILQGSYGGLSKLRHRTEPAEAKRLVLAFQKLASELSRRLTLFVEASPLLVAHKHSPVAPPLSVISPRLLPVNSRHNVRGVKVG